MNKSASGFGSVATVVGEAKTLTITPKSTFELSRIIATGDTGATLVSALSGESPLVVDPIDCSTIGPTAFHGPTFEGRMVYAGVPVTVNYTAGSTSQPLKLTLLGEGHDCL